jgi:hypothetical protein
MSDEEGRMWWKEVCECVDTSPPTECVVGR